jgi:hypothetical protein
MKLRVCTISALVAASACGSSENDTTPMPDSSESTFETSSESSARHGGIFSARSCGATTTTATVSDPNLAVRTAVSGLTQPIAIAFLITTTFS